MTGEVAASMALKVAAHHPAYYLAVAVGYVCAFALLRVLVLRGMPLGVAYGIWGACGVALTAVLGAVNYGEPLTLTTASGLALIIAGVPVIELDTHHHDSGRTPDVTVATVEVFRSPGPQSRWQGHDRITVGWRAR